MTMTQTASGRRIFFDDTGGTLPPLLLRCGSIVTRRGWDFQVVGQFESFCVSRSRSETISVIVHW